MSHGVGAVATERGSVKLAGHFGGTADSPTVVNHAQITGTADLHTEYILVSGTRAHTGAQSMGSQRLTNLGAPSAAADAVRFNSGDSPTFADLSLTGNLTVTGTRTVVGGEQVAFADNYLELNDAYTADAAQAGGLVVNYDPTTTTAAVAGAGFVAGVAAVSNPTIEVAATTGFAAGDVIIVTGATTNNGFYEVHALLVTPARLQLKGIGTVAAVEDWSKNQLITAAAAGNVFKTNVSVIRAGTDGVWESGKGSAVPLTYTDFQAASFAAAGDLSTVNAGDAAAAGALTTIARGDHQHAVATAVPVVQTIAAAVGEGASVSLARADHTHTFTAAVPIKLSGGAVAEGTSTSFSRADHNHSPVPNATGDDFGTTSARWDYIGQDTDFSGAMFRKQVTKVFADSPYTVGAQDGTVFYNATGGASISNLPAAVSNVGRVLRFVKIDSSANGVTIDGNAAETINGAATKVLAAQYEAIDIQCDGANWFIVG